MKSVDMGSGTLLFQWGKNFAYLCSDLDEDWQKTLMLDLIAECNFQKADISEHLINKKFNEIRIYAGLVVLSSKFLSNTKMNGHESTIYTMGMATISLTLAIAENKNISFENAKVIVDKFIHRKGKGGGRSLSVEEEYSLTDVIEELESEIDYEEYNNADDFEVDKHTKPEHDDYEDIEVPEEKQQEIVDKIVSQNENTDLIRKSFIKNPITITTIIILTFLLVSISIVKYYNYIHMDRLQIIAEIDMSTLFKSLAKNKDEHFQQALMLTEKEITSINSDFVNIFFEKLDKDKVKLVRYFGNRHRLGINENIEYLRQNIDLVLTQTSEIIYKRFKAFGIEGLSIKEKGHKQLILEVPISDERLVEPEFNTKLLSTSILEFRLLKDKEIVAKVSKRMNDYITNYIAENNNKFLNLEVDSLIFEENLFFPSPHETEEIYAPLETQYKFENFLKLPEIQKIITLQAGNAEFMQGKDIIMSFAMYYLLNKKVELTSETIIEAESRKDRNNKDANSDKFEVSFTFDSKGAKSFALLTEENYGKRIAIVIDNTVYHAPSIRAKITNGRVRITGIETLEEANTLSILLKSGSLPTPLKIVSRNIISRDH